MAITAFIDNFDDLSGWTASGFTATTNAVAATTGGTYGSITKDNGTGGSEGNKEYRMCCDIIPDKTDTAGRFIWIGNSSSATSLGMGVGYVAGTGIVTSLLLSSAISGPVTVVADADLTTGERYHCEIIWAWGQGSGNAKVVVQVYDIYGVFLGGQEKFATQAWFTANKITISGDSDASTISRVAFEPGYFPTSVTDDYFTGLAVGSRFQGSLGAGDSTLLQAGLSVPGRLNDENLVAIVFHGAGTWLEGQFIRGTSTAQWNRGGVLGGSYQPYWGITEALSMLGIPVIAPKQYSEQASTINSWASPDTYNAMVNGGWTGQADATDWFDWIADQYATAKGVDKADVKFIIAGYSMGSLMASRIVTNGDLSTSRISAVGLWNGVIDLVEAWKEPAWQAQLEAAWNVSYANETEARAGLGPFDPITLTTDNVNLWDNIYAQITHATTDTVVDSTLHSDPLEALLTAGAQDVKEIKRVWGTHTTTFFTSDIASFSVSGVSGVGSGGASVDNNDLYGTGINLQYGKSNKQYGPE
jgi:hypothetical protein